jgi:hypothetical protein
MSSGRISLYLFIDTQTKNHTAPKDFMAFGSQTPAIRSVAGALSTIRKASRV